MGWLTTSPAHNNPHPGKDKFLLQFIRVPEEVLDVVGTDAAAASHPRLLELWSQVDSLKRTVEDPSSVMAEKKLRCLWGEAGAAVSRASPALNNLPTTSRPASPEPATSRSVSTAPAASNANVAARQQALERELKDAQGKIKTLQTACDVYKQEIERINALRIRKAHDAGEATTSISIAGTSSAAVHAKGSSWRYKLFVLFLCALSFFIGHHFF
jgi:hypothetical protein